MKTVKMKTTKFFIAPLFAAAIIITSCKNESSKEINDNSIGEIKNSAKYNDAISNNDLAMNKEADNTESFVKSTSFLNKNGEKIAYHLDESGVIHLDDWRSFSTLESEMAIMKNLDFKITNKAINDLEGIVTSLKQTIPDWLMTDEVMEDIDDVQKEYQELLIEINANEKERVENLEELSEQLDDLQEEINETVYAYANINKKAIKKYRKKMKKGKIEAANKKYQKEMEKANDIADY